MKRPSPSLSRRSVLRRLGAASAGAVLVPAIPGCGDGDGPEGGGDDDVAAADTGAEAGAGDTGGDGVTSDATSEGGLDGSDVVGPSPSLAPLRGDGSHPYHYIDTIVIVQMENRSFDHYMGALTLLEGRDDVAGLTAGLSNPDAAGTEIAIRHLRTEYIIDPDPGHSHSASLRQFSGGTNRGFVIDYERLLSDATRERLDWVMGYHDRAQLPSHYGLADQFTLCDRWHCSLLGPTWPNRFFSHAATSDGQWSNLTPISARPPYLDLPEGKTVGLYHQGLIHFGLTLSSVPTSVYMNKGLDEFFADAEAGRLPNVCIVEPEYGVNDDHPPVDLRLGQAFIQSVYEAVRQSPQFDRTLMLVFYDEHGGFHDHVAPPKVEGETRVDEGFDQLGFRVPGFVIGPLARRGHVFSGVVDHASVPALISDVFGIGHVNERSRRAGRFEGALDLELTLDSARPAALPLPTLELPLSVVARAARRGSGQPELDELAWRHFGIAPSTYDDTMRRMERFLVRAERLGAIRVL